MLRIKYIVLAGIFAVLASGSSSFGADPVKIIGVYTLPPVSLSQLGRPPYAEADLERARTNGLKFADRPSIGSGLARVGENEFVGVSDRGPNGQVGARRTFPLPQFCPFIARCKLRDGRIEIQKTILLTDSRGRPLTGLSNQEGEERLFESAEATRPLPFDPNGVDPEAIRVFPDGKFLIAEEYGPSVLVVNSNGQVLVRYTPQTKALPDATYPVKAILPEVFKHRRTNRGFEALALSPDGRTAYVMLQSPLGGDDPKLANARVSRVLRLDLSDPLNARVTGQFLLPLSQATEFSAGQKQADVKLNDAEWLAPDKLLVLEQAGKTARLLVVDFSAASNVMDDPAAATLAFEAAGDDVSLGGVKPATVEIWATTAGCPELDAKLEGLAILSPTEIALANDNDFGIGENQTSAFSSIWILRLPRPLPLAR